MKSGIQTYSSDQGIDMSNYKIPKINKNENSF